MKLPRLPAWIFATSLVLFMASWAVGPRRHPGAPPPPPPRASWLPPPLTGHQAAPAQPGRVVDGSRGQYRVAFTFDDGPHPIYTARLLEVLKRHGIKATFFVNGYWLDRGRSPRSMEAARRVLRLAHQQGHIIANHTYSHQQLSKLSPDEQTWQIVANEVLLSSIIGRRTTLFRAPYGNMTAHATRVLAQYGYTDTRWNATTHEEQLDPPAISANVMRWIRHHHGGIVLLHDRLPHSVAAVELLLKTLDRDNCRRFKRKQPTFRVVSLQAFLWPPSSSWHQARADAAERAAHQARLIRTCTPVAVARGSRADAKAARDRVAVGAAPPAHPGALRRPQGH